MSGEIAKNEALTAAVAPNPNASLLEIRMDARTYPRLHSYTREQAVFEMSKIVTQAFLYRGQQADDNNIRYISGALLDELAEDAENVSAMSVTFTEISRAVKRAVLNNEIYSVSVASLYKVVMDYIKRDGIQASREAMRLKEQKRAEDLKKSVLAPMMSVYTGRMVRNSKTNL